MISAALAIIENDSQRNELSEIYERNIKKFYSIAFSKLHNKQDAEDAIQESFLAIAKNPALLFDIPTNKRVSYINVIVRNTAYKMWNKRNKVYDHETDLDDTVVDERISIEEMILSDYSCEQILRFIDTLPETTKAAVYLKTHLAMDNNCFYFSAESGPFVTQISSVDKNNFSVEQDVLTYNFDVEYDLSTSKRTYCGHYVAFPCSGSPSDKCVTLRALVGKSGEPQKCVLEQPTSAISVCVSELSDDEIVFLCSGENRGIFNIYRYTFGEEQAQLIFTAELEVESQNSNPLISCCNGDIYFIYRSAENKIDYCIKQLDAEGNICDEMLLSLPEHYDTSLGEFTVTENNFLIRFFPDDDFGYFQTVLINRKTNEIFSDSGDNKLGVRFNDGMADGRYIIFRAGSKLVSEHPMICVFDDWNSEFNFIEFTEIDSSEIINTVANDDGDVVFFTHKGSERFVTMYENVINLYTAY